MCTVSNKGDGMGKAGIFLCERTSGGGMDMKFAGINVDSVPVQLCSLGSRISDPKHVHSEVRSSSRLRYKNDR